MPTGAHQIRESIDRGEYATAVRAAREHLARVEATGGPDSIEAATALDLLAEALSFGATDQLEEASEQAHRALRIKESHLRPDDPRTADSLFRLGTVRDLQARHAEARELCEQALAIRRAAKQAPDPSVAEILTQLAISHEESGNYAEAAHLHQESIAILEQTRPEGDPLLALARSMYANFLLRTGDYREARALHEAALDARRRHYGRTHPRIAGSLNNLAAVDHALGDLQAAKRHLQEALRIRTETLAPGHPRIGQTALNLSIMLQGLGEHEAAAELLNRTVRQLVVALGENHPRVGHVLDAQAEQSAARGDHDLSIEQLERALRIRKRVYDQGHPLVADTLAVLAREYDLAGEPERAIELGLLAEQIGREHQAATGRVLAERHALRYSKSRESARGLALALSVAGEHPLTETALLWDALIRSRALVLAEMAERRRLSAEMVDPELSRLWDVLTSARDRLAEVAVRGPDPDRSETYAAELRHARTEKERAEQQLARKSAVFRGVHQAERLGYENVAGSLPGGAALLAYVLHADPRRAEGASHYTALILPRAGDSPRLVPIGDAEAIDREVTEFRQYLADPIPGEAKGHALRRLVWDPVAGFLPPDTQIVFVVPDGMLSLISLATLPTSAGRFFVETEPMVHYLSSERELVARDPFRRGEGLLALGDPRWERERRETNPEIGVLGMRRRIETCGLGQDLLAPLDSTAAEVGDVVELWKASGRSGALDLTGSAANEHAFKSLAPGKRILHLATHGFFLDSDCLAAVGRRRGIGGVTAGDDSVPDPTDEDPMLLSGLVLSGGAEGAPEDGILTAEEIAGLDLSGVEWAVLSACETGVGRTHAGEGVLGLRRAFHVAGASTLIMSLWSVGDEESRKWMHELYRARLEGVTSAESVRNATLTLLERRRTRSESTHPFYWGGFVASGDWR